MAATRGVVALLLLVRAASGFSASSQAQALRSAPRWAKAGRPSEPFVRTSRSSLLASTAGGSGSGEGADYETLTVEQLKQELRSRKLPVSGRKAALIERLQDGAAATARRRKTDTGAAASSASVSAEEEAMDRASNRAVFITACKVSVAAW